MCLKSVALYNQQGVVIISRHLCSFPREAVNIAMPIPLSDHSRATTLNHIQAVNNKDNRPVGFRRATAHVNDSQIAVSNLNIIIFFGFRPYPQLPLPVLMETQIFKSRFSLVSIGIHITDKTRRTARFVKLFNLVFVKHHCAGMNKSLYIIRGELGSHNAVVVLAATLLDVPVDCFQ